MFTTARTSYLVFFDEVHHLLLGPCIYASLNGNVMLCTKVLNELICTETLVALFTVHKRIRKSAKMSGSDPCLRVHKDCTVNTHIVRRLLNEFLPPCTFYVIFKLYTEISIIPCVCQAAVDLGTRVNKSSGFCKSYDLFHCLFHDFSPLDLQLFRQMRPESSGKSCFFTFLVLLY